MITEFKKYVKAKYAKKNFCTICLKKINVNDKILSVRTAPVPILPQSGKVKGDL